MRNFASDFEVYVYQLVRQSPLSGMISGKVYRSGMRPDNAVTEDIVVSFLAGLDGQFQDCFVNVNIYVPDIIHGDKPTKDIGKITTLENAFKEFFYGLKPSEYLISLDGIPSTIRVEGYPQHFINVRLRIKYNTLK